MSQFVVFYAVLMRILKWGLPFLYLKSECEKAEKCNFCSHSPMRPQLSNFNSDRGLP